MKVFAVALALSFVLMAGPTYAQAPAPAQPAPAGQEQKPAPAAPAPAAAQPATPAPPFQMGLKYAYINLQQIAMESVEGQAFNTKVEALREQKIKELQDRNKTLQASQETLEKGASVMNDQARAKLQGDIERQQRDIQRFTEDAQQEITNLQQQLQLEFERRLSPVVDRVAKEKQVHFIFNAVDSGLAWADPTMNLTADVIKAFDAGATAKPAAAVPPPAVPVKP